MHALQPRARKSAHEQQRSSRRTRKQRVADGKRARVGQADDVAGVALLHGRAALRKHLREA